MNTLFEDNRELLNPAGEALYKEAHGVVSELFEKWEDVPSREVEAVLHSLLSELANEARGDVFYNQDIQVKLERAKAKEHEESEATAVTNKDENQESSGCSCCTDCSSCDDNKTEEEVKVEPAEFFHLLLPIIFRYLVQLYYQV